MSGKNLCLTPRTDKVVSLFGRKKRTYHLAKIQKVNENDQTTESWVNVHNLRSSNDQGILDPDDKLKDVADDREQLFAAYEEHGLPSMVPLHSDGVSTSSIGTDSPDIFKANSRCSSRNDVEVNCDTIPLGLTPLHVRRGSEPALNRISPVPNLHTDPMKRWSAAVLGDDDVGPDSSSSKDQSGDKLCEEDESEESAKVINGLHPPAFQRFSSESGRLSILGNNAETVRWVDAADRQLFRFQSQEELNKDSKHKQIAKTTNLVILKNEGFPLGIHVVPDYDESGKDVGLVVQGIEPGGRIDRDGRLQVQDRIIEINDQCLLNVSFQRAQEVFKEALQTPEIRLKVLKDENDGRVGPKMATVTPTKTSVVSTASRPTSGIVLAANTRKMGKKIHIELTKGHEGLGFSVTTRDNPAGGNCPIYIKNILPRGAAVQDGRLRPGDRLLEVNGIEMTGKTQTEAVKILRNTPLGGSVKLVVSRQEADSPKLPREIADSDPVEALKPPSDLVYPFKNRETLTLIIPLNDTESAGLGVSVKGKTSTNSKGTTDLGIFVKSVIKGGAASKDRRLQENDQLLSVNDISLLGVSNSAAMETLRKAVQHEGPNPNAITLIVSRKLFPARNEMPTDTDSAASEHSDGTSLIIFNARSMILRRDSDETRNLDQRESSPRKVEDKDLGLDVPARNPVVDRLTGHRGPMASTPALRNESYYRATHDVSWARASPAGATLTRVGSVAAPTVNLVVDDSIIIEDEYSTPEAYVKGKAEASDNRLTVFEGDAVESTSAYMSQLSLDDPANNFARDGFGRQSMSEKRHAHIDAKNTDTYQRSKKAREERQKQQTASPTDFRTNSADSLLNTNHKDAVDAKRKPTIPVLGMKKSNSLESLRIKANFEVDEDRGTGSSGRRLWQKMPGDFAPDDVVRVEPKSPKKKGIFKGFGNVFKFGKPKKTSSSQLPRLTLDDLDKQKAEAEKAIARRAAQEEQERIQEQYRKLLQQQQQQQIMQNGPAASEPENRHQRIAQLRAQYQRKQAEKHSRYMENEPKPNSPAEHHQHHQTQRYESEVVHSRSRSYDVYKEIERPGSRKGIADPSKFSHYMNYEEIQQHLKKQRKKAQPEPEPFFLNQPQPSNNYYEYEVVRPNFRYINPSETSNSLPRKSTSRNAETNFYLRKNDQQQQQQQQHYVTKYQLQMKKSAGSKV